MRQDQAQPRQWLGQQQFHRAAIDFTGDGPRGPADGPDAEEDQHQWVNVADRQQIHRAIEHDTIAADDGPHDLARPLEENLLDVARRQSAQAGQRGEERRQFAEDACHHASPEKLKPTQQQRHDDEGYAAHRETTSAAASRSFGIPMIAVVDRV